MVERRRRRRPLGRIIQSANHTFAQVFRRSLASGTTPEGWLAIEGPILFDEALRAGGYLKPAGQPRTGGTGGAVKIVSVMATERGAERFAEALTRLRKESEVTLVSERLYNQLSQTESPRGIAALVELPERSLDRAAGRPNALVVVACGLQDPGNLGTLVRSAQALGASALVTLHRTVSPFNPKAIRSSAGAVLQLPVFTGAEPASLLRRLRILGLRILAADRHGSVPVQQADLRGALAVLIGQEAAGLDEDLARQADAHVAIAIRRDTDSLNAATAASIFLYEAARQRGFQFDEPV
jgi:RNA methyltransferase, TrmH family